MKKTIVVLAAVTATSMLSACGNLNSALADRQETVEMYHIFDIKTSSPPDTLIKAAADGLARNTNSVVQNRPLRIGAKVPTEPGRFEIVNMADAFKGTGMGAFLAMSGSAGSAAPRIAKCDDAIWSAKAVRDITGSNKLNLYSCLYQYQSGYQLDIYAVFQKNSGGLNGLVGGMTSSMVGTPEQWVSKTIVDTVRSIEAATSSKASYVEGQPALGSLPDVDKLDAR